MKFKFEDGHLYGCNSEAGSCLWWRVENESLFLYDDGLFEKEVGFSETEALEFMEQAKSCNIEGNHKFNLTSGNKLFVNINDNSVEIYKQEQPAIFCTVASWKKFIKTIEEESFEKIVA